MQGGKFVLWPGKYAIIKAHVLSIFKPHESDY